MDLGQRVKKDFPIFAHKINGKPLIYLDNAATTQKPQTVLQAEKNFYETLNANVHRGVYALSEKATQAYEDSRRTVKQFLGARYSEEIVFVRNTTEAIELVAKTWGREHISRASQILVTEMEHHSNLLPWKEFEEKLGGRIRYAKLTPDFRLDLADLKKQLKKPTKLVAVTAISNVFGSISPIPEIVKLARQAGAKVLVDAAQSAGHQTINVTRWNCDFLALSGHKMYGPLGIGILYGKREILQKMPPFLRGGEMVAEAHKDNVVWRALPWKFEAGTPNVAGAVGLAAAIRYLQKIGWKNLRKHEHALTQYALQKLLAVPGLKIIGPSTVKDRGGVISFVLRGVHAHDVATLLDASGIAIRSGQLCAQPLLDTLGVDALCRISFGVYNTKSEIDKLAEEIRKIAKLNLS